MGLFNSIRMGASAAGDYEVERSLRFNDDTDSAYLDRTPSGAGNRQVFTWSAWVKRGRISHRGEMISVGTSSSTSNNDIMSFRFDNSDEFCFAMYSSDVLVTTQKFRDPSAWYHIVVAVDTTQGTNTNRIKLYINGSQITAFNTSNYPTQNYNFALNAALKTSIGRLEVNGDNYFSGYLAEIHSIDGSQLTPSSFAETDAVTGEYKPKKFVGSYGTNGFYLNFSDNSGTTATTLGKDSSGNGNNFTPNGFAVNDAVKDSPTNNFATYDVLAESGGVYSEGNLKITSTADPATSTIGFASGKFYFETYVDATGAQYVGVIPIDVGLNPARGGSWSSHGAIAYRGDGQQYSLKIGSSSVITSYGASYTAGDIIGCAVDIDNDTVTFYKNGVSQGNTTNGVSYISPTGATDGIYGAIVYCNGGNNIMRTNFGQDSTFQGTVSAGGNTDANGIGDFKYTVPTGYLALCSANLPDPTIKLPNKHFDTLLYTGDQTDGTRAITGLEFTPDFVWLKCRSSATSHNLYDIVRGFGSNKEICSDKNQAEGGENGAQYGYITQNDSGFNLVKGSDGTLANAVYNININNATYAAWNWKAGGSASSNSDGSITSSVSANTSAGFSIVRWTSQSGAYTVGHGLGVAPKFLITKHLTNSGVGWPTFTTAVDGTMDYGYIAATSTFVDAVQYGINVPNSTTFQGHSDFFATSGDLIAYCFSEVAGYSKFGSYTGNGNADGPFVFTGFSPALIITKRSGGTGNWYIWDPVREGNVMNSPLQTNDSGSEPANYDNSLDILSNGFKLRATNAGTNGSNESYLYMAFAESPFKNSRAR